MSKHPGGRPTDYGPKILEKAREYIEGWYSAKGGVPNVAGLALELDIARSTVYEWANQHKEFSDILERILSTQEQELLAGGLEGNFNAAITKLMLTKHGYVEKQELTGKDGKDLIPSEVDQMTNEQLEAALKGRSTGGIS